MGVGRLFSGGGEQSFWFRNQVLYNNNNNNAEVIYWRLHRSYSSLSRRFERVCVSLSPNTLNDEKSVGQFRRGQGCRQEFFRGRALGAPGEGSPAIFQIPGWGLNPDFWSFQWSKWKNFAAKGGHGPLAYTCLRPWTWGQIDTHEDASCFCYIFITDIDVTISTKCCKYTYGPAFPSHQSRRWQKYTEDCFSQQWLIVVEIMKGWTHFKLHCGAVAKYSATP